MSTGNFSFTNICVPVFMDYTDDEYIFIEDEVQNFIEGLKKISGFEEYSNKWYSNSQRLLGKIEVRHYAHDQDPYAIVCVVLNWGYYYGGCLDYEVEYLQDRKGYLDKIVQSKCNAVRKVLKSFGDEYEVSAQFSNGETWYTKVTNKK